MLTTLFKPLNRRRLFGLISLFSFGLIAYAVYAQYYQGAEPCPLCIVQRVIYALTSLISLVALLHNCRAWGNSIYAGLLLLNNGFGIKIAYHHLWLQNLPAEQWPASCGMPLSILYKKIPLSGFIHTILSGSAECAAVDWKILGISGTFLSLCCFILLSTVAVYILIWPQAKVKL